MATKTPTPAGAPADKPKARTAKQPAKQPTKRAAARPAAQPAAQPTAQAAPQTGERHNRRQQKLGKVVSDKMQKTIVVAVESVKRDRIYKRTYKYTTKFKAHDEHNSARIGDMVRIEETRPLSKDKRWRLVQILQRAVQVISVEQAVEQLAPQLDETEAEDETEVDDEAEDESETEDEES